MNDIVKWTLCFTVGLIGSIALFTYLIPWIIGA